MLKIVTLWQLCLLLVSSSPWDFFHNCCLHNCQMKHQDEFEMWPTYNCPLIDPNCDFSAIVSCSSFCEALSGLDLTSFKQLIQLLVNKASLLVCKTFNPMYLRDPFFLLLVLLKIGKSFSTTFLSQFWVPQYTKSSASARRISQELHFYSSSEILLCHRNFYFPQF